MASIPFNEKATVEVGSGGAALLPNAGGPGVPAPVPVPAAVKSSVPKAPVTAAPVNQSGMTPSGVFIGSDGSIDFKKSLEAATATALKIKQQADELAAQQSTGSQSFVSSSAPVVQQERGTTNDVRNLMGTITPNETGISSAQAASDSYMKMLDDQAARLEKRRADETARINSQFDNAEAGLRNEQKGERGTTSAMLARAGGYLGPSGSGTGVMLNLAENHRAEVSTLNSKRADAIQQANTAIEDKQFALAQMKVKEVKDIENTIHERKTQFFNDSLKAVQEARNQDEFYRTKIKDDLETLGKLGAIDEKLDLDPARAKEIDDFYGVPGFTKQYLQTISAAAKSKSAKDNIAAQKDLIDLLEKIPAGQEVSFPDGTTYKGLGSAGDIYTTLETDDSGVGRLVTYDKRSGKINVTNVGAVGKVDNGDGGDGSGPGSKDGKKALLEDNVSSTLQIQLESEKMSDGTYDPDTYIRERKLLKEAFPEYVKTMDSKFLNPSNGFFTVDAINQLRKKGVFAASPSL